MAGSAVNLTGMIAQMNDALGRSGMRTGAGLFGPMRQMQADERELQARKELMQEEYAIKQREAQRISQGVKQLSTLDSLINSGNLTEEQLANAKLAQSRLQAQPDIASGYAAAQKNAMEMEVKRQQLEESRERQRENMAYGALLGGTSVEALTEAGFSNSTIAAAKTRAADYESKMEESRKLREMKEPAKNVPEQYAKRYNDLASVPGGYPAANKWLSKQMAEDADREIKKADADMDAFYALDSRGRVEQAFRFSSKTTGLLGLGVADFSEQFLDDLDEEQQEEAIKVGTDVYNLAIKNRATPAQALMEAQRVVGMQFNMKPDAKPPVKEDKIKALQEEAEALKALITEG